MCHLYLVICYHMQSDFCDTFINSAALSIGGGHVKGKKNKIKRKEGKFD